MRLAKISVIIPLYNKEKCIERTVQSVLNQTYKDFELIIVDDGSTDNSLRIVQQLQDNRITIYTKPNGGVSSARNFGIEKAHGEYIIFLDADDIMLPDNLKILIELQKKYNTDIVCGNFYHFRKGQKVLTLSRKHEGIIRNIIFAEYFGSVSLRIGSTLYCMYCFNKHRFDEKLSRFEDMKLILEHVKIYTMAYSPTPVLIYTCDNKGLSVSDIKNIEKDFAFYLTFKKKSLWEKLIYGQIIYFTANQQALKQKYGSKYYLYKSLAWLGFKVKKIIKL